MTKPLISGVEIKELREKLGLSQRAFGATYFDTTQATVGRWETDVTVPHGFRQKLLVVLWNKTMPKRRKKKMVVA